MECSDHQIILSPRNSSVEITMHFLSIDSFLFGVASVRCIDLWFKNQLTTLEDNMQFAKE